MCCHLHFGCVLVACTHWCIIHLEGEAAFIFCHVGMLRWYMLVVVFVQHVLPVAFGCILFACLHWCFIIHLLGETAVFFAYYAVVCYGLCVLLFVQHVLSVAFFGCVFLFACMSALFTWRVRRLLLCCQLLLLLLLFFGCILLFCLYGSGNVVCML